VNPWSEEPSQAVTHSASRGKRLTDDVEALRRDEDWGQTEGFGSMCGWMLGARRGWHGWHVEVCRYIYILKIDRSSMEARRETGVKSRKAG